MRSWALAMVLGALGCGGAGAGARAGTAGSDGNVGVATETLCSVKDNADGTKTITCDDGSESVVTNGQDGADGAALLISVSEATPSECPTGGKDIAMGLDNGDGGGVAGDGVLHAGEVDETTTICAGADGFSTLFSITDADTSECPDGGTHVAVGLDDGAGAGTARDGLLHGNEVDDEFAVCGGANGSDGSNGVGALITLSPADPAECPDGGQRLDTGLDNGDGSGVAGDAILQSGEIDDTVYLCGSTSVSPSDRAPTAGCQPASTAYPADMMIVGSGSGFDGDLIDAYYWRLDSVPGGSAATLVDPGVPSFLFTPDVAGPYTFCLTVESRGLLSAESCCTRQSVTALEWSVDTTQTTSTVEEIEFNGGGIRYSFNTNQSIVAGLFQSLTNPMCSSSDPAWDTTCNALILGSIYLPQFTEGVTGNIAAVSAGDMVSFSGNAEGQVTGDTVTLVAMVTLTNAVDPGPTTPQIVDLQIGPFPFVNTATRLAVMFDGARPPGNLVQFGGWLGPGGSVFVNDDGEDDDLVAGDGWYSGRVTFSQAGTYNLLFRARAGTVSGPFYRAMLEIQ